MKNDDPRFWICIAPDGDPFSEGWGVVDEKDGGIIAYFAHFKDADAFLKIKVVQEMDESK